MIHEDDETVPVGKLRSTITRLAMTQCRDHAFPPPLRKTAVMIAEEPICSFYRYLYNSVGERWLWFERRKWSDQKLTSWLRSPDVTLFVLYVAGVPAGFAEFNIKDRFVGVPATLKDKRVAQLAYFGLIPEFIGRGLGAFFLSHTMRSQWSEELDGMVVDTCDWDHPKAIVTYQKAGFEPVAQQRVLVDDPRVDGILPRDAGSHIPII